YALMQNGNDIIIKTKVPVNWLTSSDRNFPIIIDPTVNFYPSAISRWTGYLRTNSVTSNTIGGTTSNDVLRLGKNASDRAFNSWAKFDITGIPDASCITSSSLWYKIFTNSTSDANCTTWIRTRDMVNDP